MLRGFESHPQLCPPSGGRWKGLGLGCPWGDRWKGTGWEAGPTVADTPELVKGGCSLSPGPPMGLLQRLPSPVCGMDCQFLFCVIFQIKVRG